MTSSNLVEEAVFSHLPTDTVSQSISPRLVFTSHMFALVFSSLHNFGIKPSGWSSEEDMRRWKDNIKIRVE